MNTVWLFLRYVTMRKHMLPLLQLRMRFHDLSAFVVELSSGTMDEVSWLDAPCIAPLLSGLCSEGLACSLVGDHCCVRPFVPVFCIAGISPCPSRNLHGNMTFSGSSLSFLRLLVLFVFFGSRISDWLEQYPILCRHRVSQGFTYLNLLMPASLVCSIGRSVASHFLARFTMLKCVVY